MPWASRPLYLAATAPAIVFAPGAGVIAWRIRAELAAPIADSFVGDHHTTFGEDELNVAKAQAEEVI